VVRAARSLGALALAVMIAGSALVARAVSLEAHPLHTSLAQLTLDERASTVEISLRLFADDFSRAAAQYAGMAPARDSTVPERAAQAYLAYTFAVADANRAPLALEWCGMRRAAEITWV
jgi:hypothetical protein